MKNFAYAILLCAIFGQLNAAPHAKIDTSDLVDKVKDAIERIAAAVRDPLEIEDKIITIPENDIENGELDITEASISGLSGIEVTSLTFDEETLRLDFLINNAKAVTHVLTDLDLSGIINVKDHELSVDVTVSDFQIEGYAVIAEDLESIEDLSVLASYGEINVELKGLLDNEELSKQVSEYLTENSAKVLNSFNVLISSPASHIIKDAINFVLRVLQ